jgi:uncharacterized membrane protein YgcG
VLAAAAVVVAGLIGWALADAFAPTRHAPPAASPSTERKVTVDRAVLVGKPVTAVVRQLSREGLRPRVSYLRNYVVAAEEGFGVVVSVGPSGRLPAGSVVRVRATPQLINGGEIPGLGTGNGVGNSTGTGNGGRSGNGGSFRNEFGNGQGNGNGQG